jgi:MazG family protein
MTAVDEFTWLVEIMRRLRTQCPWDRSQTHETLRVYLLEETYEVLNALDGRRWDNLREELGDLILQIVFHAEIAEEAGLFNIHDVLRDINEKLVRRHPHVFGDKQAETPADVVRRWESIKTGEEQKPSSLDGVPEELPALAKASRVLTKVRQTGVDPFRSKDALIEARLWLERLAQAAERGDAGAASRAMGLLMLAATEIADRVRASPEDALRETLRRLAEAFRAEEDRVRAEGRTFAVLSAEEIDQIAARVMARCEEA